jgi:hypothetical protein
MNGDQINRVAPAQAGAHRVSLGILTGGIGTSLRWCDGYFEG